MPANWLIQPSVCITNDLGDECRFRLSITTENIPKGNLCLYLNQVIISCSQRGFKNEEVLILIKNNAVLELKDHNQRTLLSEKLLIKYQKVPTLRRRIRNPWSLF